MPLRLGDGTGLKAKGFTEIRLGDGTIIWASGPTIVDGFEDNDTSEYSGSTADYSTQSTTVQEGSYALESAGNSSSIYSTAGLNAYPSQGDTFRCWMQPKNASGGVGEWHFGLTDSNNNYAAVMNTGASSFDLAVRDAGNKTNLASASYNWNAEWYDIEIEWLSDGTINGTVYDSTGTQVASASATDTTYSSGGIGFLDFNAGYYWDHYRVI